MATPPGAAPIARPRCAPPSTSRIADLPRRPRAAGAAPRALAGRARLLRCWRRPVRGAGGVRCVEWDGNEGVKVVAARGLGRRPPAPASRGGPVCGRWWSVNGPTRAVGRADGRRGPVDGRDVSVNGPTAPRRAGTSARHRTRPPARRETESRLRLGAGGRRPPAPPRPGGAVFGRGGGVFGAPPPGWS